MELSNTISNNSSNTKVFQPSPSYVISAFFSWIFISFCMLFFIGLFGIILIPFIIIFGTIYSYLRLKSTFVEIQEDGIQIRAGVIVKSRSFYVYSKIQDIQLFQGLADRILGLQSISIKTMTIESSFGGNIPGLKTEDAEYIKEFVLKKLNKSFTKGATVNNGLFATASETQDSTENMRLNPWPVHFFKPLILILVWLIPLLCIFLVIGVVFPFLFFILGIIAVFLLLMFGGRVLSIFIQSISFKYYVGKTRIEIEKKFISSHKNTLPIFKVQDIVIFRNFWNRLIGLVDINLETGEMQVLDSANSKQGYQYEGNFIPFLDYNGSIELRKYIFDVLGLNISQAEPALVKEHPLEARKVIKKTITGTIVTLLGFFFISLFILVPITSVLFTQNIYYFGIPLAALLVFGILALVSVIVLFQAIYQYYYLKTYYYNISKDVIIVRKGVLSTSEIVLPFRKIQNVFVDQDLLDKLFGLYDVHFSTVTTMSANLCHVDGLNKQNAEEVREILMTMISK